MQALGVVLQFSLAAILVIHVEGHFAAAGVLLLVASCAKLDVALALVDHATAAHEADTVEGGESTALVFAVGSVWQ